jgi:CRISPR/Cas system endoribonuclease Cas6 (RAMP superfamily)
MQLLGAGYKKFPYKIEGEIVSKNIEYKELTRLSNRQKITMNLGGIMGAIDIRGINKECYEVLKLGELLGVGKQTVFGLGKIKIKDK